MYIDFLAVCETIYFQPTWISQKCRKMFETCLLLKYLDKLCQFTIACKTLRAFGVTPAEVSILST